MPGWSTGRSGLVTVGRGQVGCCTPLLYRNRSPALPSAERPLARGSRYRPSDLAPLPGSLETRRTRTLLSGEREGR